MAEEKKEETLFWEGIHNEMGDIPVTEKSTREFIELTSCEWDEVKESVDLAARSFAFDGFDPIRTGNLIAERALERKNIATLVVLALEVGSYDPARGIRVVSSSTAMKIINLFGVVKSGRTGSEAITLPRVILCFPSYAFRILSMGKVQPKVTTPYWPVRLSFNGSLNALPDRLKNHLLMAYTVWSTVFGLTISQGTMSSKNKKIVERLTQVTSGHEIDHITWSRNLAFSETSIKTMIVTRTDAIKNAKALEGLERDLAVCVVFAKRQRIPNESSMRDYTAEIDEEEEVIGRLIKEARKSRSEEPSI